MGTSNSVAPPALRAPTGSAGLAALVLRIPVNLVRWIAVLAHAPRARSPRLLARGPTALSLAVMESVEDDRAGDRAGARAA